MSKPTAHTKWLRYPRTERVVIYTTKRMLDTTQQFADLDGISLNQWIEKAILRHMPAPVRRELKARLER